MFFQGEGRKVKAGTVWIWFPPCLLQQPPLPGPQMAAACVKLHTVQQDSIFAAVVLYTLQWLGVGCQRSGLCCFNFLLPVLGRFSLYLVPPSPPPNFLQSGWKHLEVIRPEGKCWPVWETMTSARNPWCPFQPLWSSFRWDNALSSLLEKWRQEKKWAM